MSIPDGITAKQCTCPYNLLPSMYGMKCHRRAVARAQHGLGRHPSAGAGTLTCVFATVRAANLRTVEFTMIRAEAALKCTHGAAL